MALLQRLLRRQQQPTPSRKPPPTPARSLSWLLDAAVQRARSGQALLCLLGVLGLALLPLLERRIEFDENALLAGSARPTISYAVPSALDAGRAFADGLRPTFFSFVFSTALQAALSAGGLEVSNHTFSDSSSSSSSGGGPLSCVNVHAVVRSPRGDGKEALVLVTPINHQHIATDFQQDGSGVALSLALGYALAAHLGSAAASPWLAKELIWLLPDASCGLMTSLDAWTHTYQLQPLRDAGSSPHFARAGVLQQALLLEAPSGSFNALQVSLEGAAGQLPKLDMFWLFRWYCQAYVSAPVELPQQPHGSGLAPPLRSLRALLAPLVPLLPLPVHEAEAALDGHLLKLQALGAFMRRQAHGLPTGGHAAFKGLGVDAATLRLLRRGADGQLDGPVGFTGAGNADGAGSAEALGDAAAMEAAVQRLLAKQQQQQQQQDDALQGDEHLVGFDMALLQLGNVFEAALRSCSGLIERFHHSLFLYVLTSLGTYVSVERYIGPLLALIAALLLQAAYLARNAAEQDAERAAFREAAAAAAAATRDSSSKAAGSDSSSSTTVKLNPLVEAHRLRVPASQAAAAAQRSEWVGALQLVAACHAAAVCAASLARSAACAAVAAAAAAGPLQQSLAALQRSLEAAEGLPLQHQWLGRLAAAPQQHGWELGLGAGLLVSLALACEGLLSTCAARAPPSCSSRSRRRGVSVRKVLVVELSVAAAVLAAIACVNWALGYVLCLLLVPLSLTATRQEEQQQPGSSAARALRGSVALCCSPLGALLLLSAATPGVGLRGALRPSWLQWLVAGSSRGTYLVTCGLYLPCWLVSVWALLA